MLHGVVFIDDHVYGIGAPQASGSGKEQGSFVAARSIASESLELRRVTDSLKVG